MTAIFVGMMRFFGEGLSLEGLYGAALFKTAAGT